MSDISYAQVFTAVVTAGATTVLAWLTHRLVLHQREALAESRQSRGASVFVDIEMQSSEVILTVGNTGHSPARNLRLTVVDSLPWSTSENLNGFANVALVKEGLSYLAPGRILKYTVGFIDWKKNATDLGTAHITLTYQPLPGLEKHDEFTIRLSEYSGVLLESFSHPSSRISQEIRRLGDTLRRKDSTRLFLMPKEPCPHCYEQVSKSATKCPHCHEPIKKQPQA